MTSSVDISELARRCKGSVTLEINPHRDNYQTVEEYIEENLPWGHGINRLPVDAIQIFRLYMYPRSPIGFYCAFDTTFEGVVAQAHAILDELEAQEATGQLVL